MNTAKLKGLQERYSPKPIPNCHICGAEMTVQRISGKRITYGCSGATYDDAGCHYAPGRDIADEHYAQSRVTVVDVSDPDVIELIAALEAAQRFNAALATENAAARDAVQVFCDVVGDNTDAICEAIGKDGVMAILSAMRATGNLPATDALLSKEENAG
ncbi:ead/Ea22-like family protein [Cronobacter malonaticus]|nr:ead/Ea22-like family protein [Cronobacter malonaticus]